MYIFKMKDLITIIQIERAGAQRVMDTSRTGPRQPSRQARAYPSLAQQIKARKMAANAHHQPGWDFSKIVPP